MVSRVIYAARWTCRRPWFCPPWGFVGGSFPFLDHHSFPQCTAGAPVVAHWVLDPLGAGNKRSCAAGAPGLALWVPDPLRTLTDPKDASGAPVVGHWVLDPLGTGKQCPLPLLPNPPDIGRACPPPQAEGHLWGPGSHQGTPRHCRLGGVPGGVRYDGVAHPRQSLRPQREHVGTGCEDRGTTTTSRCHRRKKPPASPVCYPAPMIGGAPQPLGVLRLAMRRVSLTVPPLGACLLSLGAARPMGVTGLAVAQLFLWLKWGDGQ